MKSKKYLKRRKWLRPSNSWGPHSAIHSEVALDVWKASSKETSEVAKQLGINSAELNGSICFTDCHGSASFDFNADSRKQWDKHMKAINRLVREVDVLYDAWIEAGDDLWPYWTALEESKDVCDSEED